MAGIAGTGGTGSFEDENTRLRLIADIRRRNERLFESVGRTGVEVWKFVRSSRAMDGLLIADHSEDDLAVCEVPVGDVGASEDVDVEKREFRGANICESCIDFRCLRPGVVERALCMPSSVTDPMFSES